MYEQRETPVVPTSPLLTVNAGGSVPVPTYVEDRIKAAWDTNEVARRIRRTYYKGNLQVGFEASSDGAQIHEEGASPVEDEELILGIVTLFPQMVKKTIRLSDEVLDMRGEAFLDYLIDEFENKIVARISDGAIEAILNAPASSDSTNIGVPATSKAAGIDTVVSALALLTNDAARPVAVMHRGTYADIRAAALNANYAVDPFEGCEVIFSSYLDDYAHTATGQPYMIVGDLSAVQANFPNGDDIKFVIDPYTEATKDLVRITGRVYAGIGITGVGMLAVVKKP
jgi:HK97 family phage major capsid protein